MKMFSPRASAVAPMYHESWIEAWRRMGPALYRRVEESSQPGGKHVNQEDCSTEASARSSGWSGEEGIR